MCLGEVGKSGMDIGKWVACRFDGIGVGVNNVREEACPSRDRRIPV